MPVDIEVVPAAPTAQRDAVRVEVTEAEVWDASAEIDPEDLSYPAQPAKHYYLTFEEGGEILGQSYVFGVSAVGKHEFYDYIFPKAGSWTVRLNDSADDSSVATQAVTVAELTE